jgi:hypothetical protein
MTASPYPYLIFYEVAGTDVIIHAVRHAARNPNWDAGLRLMVMTELLIAPWTGTAA